MGFKQNARRIFAMVMCLLTVFASFGSAETEAHLSAEAEREMVVVSMNVDAPVEELAPAELPVLMERAEVFDPEADLDIDINAGCDEHVYDEDGVCMSCGNTCVHPEDSVEEDRIPIAYAQLNDEQHNVTYELISKCWVCGMTVEYAEDTIVVPEDHFDWERECECGYINENFVEDDDEEPGSGNKCTHPDLEVSIFWEFSEYITHSEDDHEILWIEMKNSYCPECEYDADRPTGKTVVRVEPHEWEEEGTGFCSICAALCGHKRTVRQNYWDADYACVDENGHSVVQTLHASVRCLECAKTYSVKTEEKLEYTEAHVPSKDDPSVCGKCEYVLGDVPVCGHTETVSECVYEIAGIEKGDKAGHSVSYKAWIAEVCAECGEEINAENRVRDAEKDYTATESHRWSRGNRKYAYGDCGVCGYKNTCTHAKATTAEVHVGLSYSDITETTHDGVGIIVEIFDCPDCGWSYSNANGKTVTESDEPHTFVKGVCACGYECVHSAVTESNDDISWNVNEHTIVTTTTERCGKCDVVFSETPVTAVNPHAFENDVCTVCGFDGIRSISLPETMALGLKESRIIPMSFLPGSAKNNITYTSGRKSVVSVDSKSGKMTAKKTGTAVITASTPEGAIATCEVTVKKAPTGIKASKSTLTLGVGETYTITGKLSSKSASLIRFSSGKKSVATVDENGVITAVAPGTAKITLKTFNGKKATCTVTVKAAPEQVSVNASKLEMSVGQTSELKTVLTGAEGKAAAGACTYSIADECAALATLDGNVLTADKEGTVTVISTAYNGERGSVDITILPAPDKAKLDIENLAVTLGVGETLTLRPGTENGSPADFTYSSSAKKTVAVNDSGKITAKRKGTAEITVKPHLGDEAILSVNVVSAPKSVKLSAKKLTVGVGEPVQLTASLSKGSASALKWKSSRTSVVEVDRDGNLIAKKPGKATITVTTFNKKKATCSVTVKAAPEVVELTASKTYMSVGQSAGLNAALSTFGGASAAGSVNFTALPEGILEFNGKTIRAIAAGQAEITATAYNGANASITIDVVEAPDAVVLEKKEITLGVKETYTVKPSIANGSPADYTYSTSKKSVATVSSTGRITAKKKGTAVITVTANGVVSETITVTVKAAPKSVKLSCKTLKLTTGEIAELTATTISGASEKLTWTSSNKNVATVKDGMVTAVGKGKATITVKTFNGKKATCTVTVAAEENPVQNG